jgi:DNA-binding CsgD family transcriptional regulator
MICGIGKLVDDGAEIEHVITSNVPNEYLQTLHQIGGMRMSPVFNEWVKTRNPVLFDSTEDCNSSEWLENFNRHEMQNMVAHGQCDISSNSVSYFSFSRIPGSLNLHHVNVIKMLVPYLHVVLIRIFMDKNKSDINLQLPLQKKLLTARQVEVLKLFATGLSYKQISESLQIKSHKTVEKHIDSARNKLSVKTRRSCIQKAIELGLI